MKEQDELAKEKKVQKNEVRVYQASVSFPQRLLMSKKLIEFLVHFSDFSYNIITYFYADICTIYQIYILQKFKA